MTVITIKQSDPQATAPPFAATVSFGGMGDYPITVTDPFDAKQEALLEWYFEEHLRFPFLEEVKAKEAAASITAYGEALFAQIFTHSEMGHASPHLAYPMAKSQLGVWIP